MRLSIFISEFSLERKIAERITPNIGVEKLYTETLEAGLYLRSTPQRA